MNTIFEGNYEGPLYAPHPDLINVIPAFGSCYNYKRLKKEGLIDYKEDEKKIYDDYSDPFGGH